MSESAAQSHSGGCHCGNIHLTFESAIDPADFEVRACQCHFCRKHNTLAVADPDGRLSVVVDRSSDLQRYVFGLRTAEYLLCRTCGVYVAAIVDADSHPRALVVVNALDDAGRFSSPPVPSNYDLEDAAGRTARRRAGWTPVDFEL